MPADDLKIQLRLPRDLHEQLVADAARHVRSLNGEIVAAIRRGHGSDDETVDDAGQRFIVRRLASPTDGLLPFVVIDRHYQFGQHSFGTAEEAQRIADEWNDRYPQAPTPQPAAVI
jgi:hypothetical protein